jgi:hypothetical protein
VTSGGIDSGADPIFERHSEVDAKVLAGTEGEKAGNRKLGIDSEVAIDAEAIRFTHRRRAGVNIVDVSFDVL